MSGEQPSRPRGGLRGEGPSATESVAVEPEDELDVPSPRRHMQAAMRAPLAALLVSAVSLGGLPFAAGTVASAVVVVGCDRASSDPLPSVRLGMAPRDVRERFKPGGEGTWQTRVGQGEDTVLEWTSHDRASRVPSARFEFHLGMLVAVRARLAEPSSRERIDTTARTVTVRSPAAEGGTAVTVLARDCPTHKDEAESLVARAK